MRKGLPILLIFIFLLNCPKRVVVPRLAKIDAIYLGNLYDDIMREPPFLSGIANIPGMKIGYVKTRPPFLNVLLKRWGFYSQLNELPIDFVITNMQLKNKNYFTIHPSMGYGIKNFKGIRFAILSKDKDSLTIEDEITLSLIKQRSDILWVIDNNFLKLSPVKIEFHIAERTLKDTNLVPLKNINTDTLILNKLKNLRNAILDSLNNKISLEDMPLDEYILLTINKKKEVNVILYPEDFIHNIKNQDSVSIKQILNNILCDLRFSKLKLTRDEVMNLVKKDNYKLWGKLQPINAALLPDKDGEYAFDCFYD